jgi:hypothetical protein
MDPPRRPVLIPVATPRRSSRLPTGRRLELDKVLLPLIEDGLIVVADAARAKAAQREARSAAEVHPLVLIANLKLPNPQRPGAELTLERLTEWLAAEVALPYLRIDPTRVDVAAVTALISHQYAQRHRILPVAIEAQRYVFATCEPTDTRWLPDLQKLLRRDIALVVCNPMDLHRYSMEFFGVTRSVRNAKDARDDATSLPSFEQLVELGRTGEVGSDEKHVVLHRRLAAAVRLRAARLRHPPGTAARHEQGALPHRRRAAQGVRTADPGDDRRGEPDQGAGAHGPGRTPAPAGRTHQDPLAGRARSGNAPVDHAHRLRREVRDAHLRPGHGAQADRAARLQPRRGEGWNRSSRARTASCWSPARPDRARPPRCIPRSSAWPRPT